jgi:hypothetical protein
MTSDEVIDQKIEDAVVVLGEYSSPKEVTPVQLTKPRVADCEGEFVNGNVFVISSRKLATRKLATK